MAVITSRNTWPVDNQETRMQKGKLIVVELGPGHRVKMYESDAIARGLVKVRPAEQDKLRPAGRDKSRSVAPAEEVGKPETPQPAETPADDFTTIPGVGPATARALVAHGIETFEQLRKAGKIDYVTPKTLAAIETWRQSSG